LSIVASVAKAHGGQAEAHARPDGGLDVQIRLPTAAHDDQRRPILADRTR
jgi:signal transduction histidine kinase